MHSIHYSKPKSGMDLENSERGTKFGKVSQSRGLGMQLYRVNNVNKNNLNHSALY